MERSEERKRHRSRSRSPPIWLSWGIPPSPSPPKPRIDGAPWISEETVKTIDPLCQLHEEIIDFYDYMQPRSEELLDQEYALEELSKIAKLLWSSSTRLEVFGSIKTALWVAGSDIDIALRVPEYGPGSRETTCDLLEIFARNILAKFAAEELERVYRARIPIIKVKHRTTGVRFDICIDETSGLRGTALVQEYLIKYPEAKYLVCVLKYFLKQRCLNSTYTGGIGSFLLFWMVVASLQRHPAYSSDRANCNRYSLAHYLLHFLRFYGATFQYSRLGISVVGEGSYFTKQEYLGPRERTDLLYLACPENIQVNLARGAYKIKDCREAFSQAYRLICLKNYAFGNTLLSMMIRYDDVLQNRPPLTLDS